MKNLFPLLILSLLFFSCDNSTESEYNEDYIYPISLGNTWIYEGTFSTEMYETSNSSNDLSLNIKDTIVVDSFYSEVDNIFRFKTVRSEEFQDETPSNFIGYQYISNGSNGLLHHGYESPGGSLTLPRSISTKKKYKINDVLFTHEELINFFLNRFSDITWEEEPLVSIKYPFKINDQWVYRRETLHNDPWRMDRVVIEKNNDEFKIQTLYDLDHDLSWDDNIKVFHTYSYEKGLIKYSLTVDSTQIMDENGNSSGHGKSQTNLDLIKYQTD